MDQLVLKANNLLTALTLVGLNNFYRINKLHCTVAQLAVSVFHCYNIILLIYYHSGVGSGGRIRGHCPPPPIIQDVPAPPPPNQVLHTYMLMQIMSEDTFS